MLILTCSLCFAISCNSSVSKKAADPQSEVVTAPKPYATPPVPSILVDPAQQADFVVTHYWDNFNFSDTSLISRKDYTEQAFVDFVNILPHVSLPLAAKGLACMMGKAEADSAMYAHFISLTEKYYYEPNSPFRNEELYIFVLRAVVANPSLEDVYKIRPQSQLELALKNRLGERAINFAYTTPQGTQSNLYAAKGKHILLFFFRPECEVCTAVKKYVEQSNIAQLATIVWVNPDEDIHVEEIYDLRASPTLYLLDSKHNVLLKDAPIEQIEAYLKGDRPTGV